MAMKVYDLVVKSKKDACYAYMPDAILSSPNKRSLYRFLYSEDSCNWPDWISSFYFYAQEGLTDVELTHLDYLEVLGPYALFSENFFKVFHELLQTEVIFHPIQVIAHRGEGKAYNFYLAKFLRSEKFLRANENGKAMIELYSKFTPFLLAKDVAPEYAYCYFASESMVNICKENNMQIAFKEAKFR
ncbi:hypothetical protein [Iodobacter ciconiae]|uniref:Uncharacterized protein n=1 Tax=Iodobacter ciconiae TaxID=2496266 RepID=A0A3S8ZPU6_9NEIS|nr:hypothetical protein [Iodobacter ciconiae]AZN35498.1 hypothetical protein EJO50_02745 [Iodobacter ciconiae]